MKGKLGWVVGAALSISILVASGYGIITASADTSPQTNVACATATASLPNHTVGVDGSDIFTITGTETTASNCETQTYTIPTSTVTTTVTTTPTTSSTSTSSTSSTSTTTTSTTSSSPPAGPCAGVNGSNAVSQTSLDSCGLPSMNNTGPRAGTVFTNHSSMTISTAGTYSGLNISGGLTINASNVIVTDSQITDHNVDSSAVSVSSSATNVQIKYTSIHGTSATQSGALQSAVGYFGKSISGVVLDHDNFYNGDRILQNYGTVTNSYCLGGAHFNDSSGGLEHDECIYTDGSAPGIKAIHDTFLNANPDQTAAIFIDGPQFGGGGVNGVEDVENSLLGGGDYCIYGGGESPAHTGTETITGNRFSRLYFNTCGQFGTSAHFPSGSNVTWSGNVWDDTGKPVT